AEVKAVVQDYKRAAERAKAAGFSGVEVHSANGYLVNQFLDEKTNKREDEYGGSLENRYRFLKEIIESVLEVFPASQVGVRLSPNGVFNDMGGADFREIYDYVIKELDNYKLGYLHVMDGLAFGFHEQGKPYTLEDVKKNYKGVVMGNCGYNPINASEAIENKTADLIAFGRPFITNPDLPKRIKENLELTPFDDMSRWYGGGAEGYTDYPKAP
ncbi:MAG: alkene reductase, partial [Bacteriovoracaceae bacterium]|nr:alkene reductase [Bacteriovoracaceae bacterium]